ncbi:MAG: hypothetical protein ACJ712_11570 [Nitrososphaeraceae archaeon]
MTTTTAIRVQSASAGATEPDNITAINPTGPGVGMLLQVQNLITIVRDNRCCLVVYLKYISF